MTRKSLSIPAALALPIFLALLPSLAGTQDEEPEPAAQAEGELQLWDDPEFRKDFLGSFRFNAEIEPLVTTVEREQMEKKVLPLLSSDPEAARVALEELTKPESSAVFDFTLGNLYFQDERFEEAERHYVAALEKFPSFRRAHKNLGLIRVRTGRFGEAVGSLSRVIQLGGGDGLTYGLLGYSYSSTEQHLQAESAYREALLLQPDALDWKLGLTQSVLRQRKFGEAVTLTDELIRAYPDRSDFWLLQSNAYIGLGRPMDAARNLEVVQRMGKAGAASLYTLGDIYVNEEMFDLAALAYGRAMEQESGGDFAQPMRRVEVLAQRGALDQATDLIAQIEKRSAGALDEEQRRQLLKLRSRISVAAGEDGSSADVLEEIVALDPLDGEALILLGQHYARVDEPDRAAFYYERAESIPDFEADASTRHAQLLVGMARYGEAVPLLKRAQEINPREDVGRYLEQVERLARGQR